MLNRLARSCVLRHLSELRGGRLAVHDALGSWESAEEGDLAAAIVVRDPRFYQRLVQGGSLGAGDAWLDGDWDCGDLTALFRLLLKNVEATGALDSGIAALRGWFAGVGQWFRRNTRAASRRQIAAHYDLGNDFFRTFLDETLTYSSGIFLSPASTLRDAQFAKLDRICRKLDLRPHDHLLEIGSGWGSCALHAAQHYGCRVTTTTISREQCRLARERVAQAGLQSRVEVVQHDYRDLCGQFDKLVSIEMIEAVGHRFLDRFFGRCCRLLKPDGLLALQAIVMNEQGYSRYRRSIDFIQKHVFPGGCLPSIGAMTAAVARATDLRLVHLEDFAGHYERTLQCWRARFCSAGGEVRRLGYPERLIRLWHYYLCYCEAAFAERSVGLVQVLWARPQARSDAPIATAFAGREHIP